MPTLTPNGISPFLLLACSLALASSTTFCNSDSSSAAAEKAPGKPSLTPTGPELMLQPNMPQSLHAASPGAARFEWDLQGEGQLSQGDGDTVLYTAPDHGGAIALVTVIAHNQDGASPQSSISISTVAPSAVQLDAIGIPAGWMTPAAINLSSGTARCHSGADCTQVHYRAGSTWAGVVWWPKACGEKGTPEAWRRAKDCSCAVDVLRAGNLHTISRVRFWARGERGGEVVEFKVGDDTLCPLSGRSSGLTTLTTDWKPYDIDLGGLEMTRAVGLFIWVANDQHNPQGATFYLDDVQFEGTR
jgi:hypothetical protein